MPGGMDVIFYVSKLEHCLIFLCGYYSELFAPQMKMLGDASKILEIFSPVSVTAIVVVLSRLSLKKAAYRMDDTLAKKKGTKLWLPKGNLEAKVS